MRKLTHDERAFENERKRKALIRLKRMIEVLETAQKAIQHGKLESLHSVFDIAYDSGDEPERWAEWLDREVTRASAS